MVDRILNFMAIVTPALMVVVILLVVFLAAPPIETDIAPIEKEAAVVDTAPADSTIPAELTETFQHCQHRDVVTEQLPQWSGVLTIPTSDSAERKEYPCR